MSQETEKIPERHLRNLERSLGESATPEPKEQKLGLCIPRDENEVDCLDPELEEMIRHASMGDLEEERRLIDSAKKSSLLREFFRNPGSFSLTSSGFDLH